MSGLQFTYTNSLYKTTGPAEQGILLKNKGKNAIVNAQMGMPQKFYPSAGDSMFSNARQAYVQDSGGGTILSGHFDASQQIALKKLNAIGKSSTGRFKVPVSFQGQAQKQDSYRNSALARVRGGGCVAPKKKGAIANKFKGTCGCYGESNISNNIDYYTILQVMRHNQSDDAWIAYNGKVYNITTSEFDMAHIPSQHWGTDITNEITSSHTGSTNPSVPTTSNSVEKMLAPFVIGILI